MKIIEIVATRCQILRLKLKMHLLQFWLGLHPRPCLRSLQRFPDPLAGFKVPTSKEMVRESREGTSPLYFFLWIYTQPFVNLQFFCECVIADALTVCSPVVVMLYAEICDGEICTSARVVEGQLMLTLNSSSAMWSWLDMVEVVPNQGVGWCVCQDSFFLFIFWIYLVCSVLFLCFWLSVPVQSIAWKNSSLKWPIMCRVGR